MTQHKQAVLIVHGAWHTPVHYQELVDILRTRGFHVAIPLLPTSQGRPFPTDPAENDIAVIRETALQLIGEGYEITAIAHSYGGFVVTEALHGLGTNQRQTAGQSGGVRRILYVAAFLLDEGHTCEMDAPVEILRFCRYEGDEKVMTPGYDIGAIMYSDLPPEQRRRWLDLTVPHPKAPSFYKPKHFAYREIKSIVVFTELDAAISFAAQVSTVEAFRKKGVDFQAETLKSGHFPSLSVPHDLADIVEKYAKLGS